MSTSEGCAGSRQRRIRLRRPKRLPAGGTAVAFLLAVLVMAGLLPVKAQAVGTDEVVSIPSADLCHAQVSVDRLVARISAQNRSIQQQKASIAAREAALTSGFAEQAWNQRLLHTVHYLGHWSLRQADIVSRYVSIATLETSLLVAHSKLRAARTMVDMPQDPFAACAAESQLLVAFPASAGVSPACRGPQPASCARAASSSSSESSTTWVSAEDS